MISEKQIIQLLRDEYGLKKAKIKNLGGFIDKIYRIDSQKGKFVLKISLNQKMNNIIFGNQLFLIHFFEKNKIAAPRIIKTLSGDDYSFVKDYRKRFCILFEFIRGEKIKIETAAEAIKFANWIAKIHKLCLNAKTTNKKFYYDPIKMEVEKIGYANKLIKRKKKAFSLPLLSLKQKIIKKYESSKDSLTTGLFNNDLSEENIVVKNGINYILDFNTSGWNYLIDELSWILSWYFYKKDRKNLIKPFLAAYQKKIKLNKKEKEMLRFIPILYSYLQYGTFEKLNSKKEAVSLLAKINLL